jgi:hypothetical protein
MYDLPALVEHVCQETGYDKVSSLFVRCLHIASTSHRLSKSFIIPPLPQSKQIIARSLIPGRIHRPLARKRPSIHLPLPINGPIPRKEAFGIHSISSSRLCWAFDYGFSIYGAE